MTKAGTQNMEVTFLDAPDFKKYSNEEAQRTVNLLKKIGKIE
jgi:hypothetical protein